VAGAGRVDQPLSRFLPEPAAVDGGVPLGLHHLAVEQHRLVAVLGQFPDGAGQLLDLGIGHRDLDHPGPAQITLDRLLLDRLADRREVSQAELLQQRNFVGKAGEAVAQPVDQGRGHEAPIAPAGPDRQALPFDQDDISAGVTFLGADRGPESGQPAADHDQVGFGFALERWTKVRPVAGEPERRGLGVGIGAAVGFTRFRLRPDCVASGAGDGLTVSDPVSVSQPAGILASCQNPRPLPTLPGQA